MQISTAMRYFSVMLSASESANHAYECSLPLDACVRCMSMTTPIPSLCWDQRQLSLCSHEYCLKIQTLSTTTAAQYDSLLRPSVAFRRWCDAPSALYYDASRRVRHMRYVTEHVPSVVEPFPGRSRAFLQLSAGPIRWVELERAKAISQYNHIFCSPFILEMTQSNLEYLTEAQVNQFYHDGYLRIPGFLEPDETDALLTRSKQLLNDFSLEDHPLIRYFLETDAVDKDGKLNREKEKAVNKIGHALHELDPVFRKVTLEEEKLKAVVRDLRFHHNPLALQSMVITKQPQIGGEVPEHNDSTFLYTSPPSALGFWFALEKCTPENGALSFLPGSHLTTPIAKRFVRLPSGGTGFEELVPPEEVAAATPSGKYILAECGPGDLVLIHGSVLHKSPRNTSPNTRFAYTFHMIESAPYAEYDEKNWLQPTPSMPFSRILDTPNPTVLTAGA
ncbi:hypothetical protein EVG20_g4252 [Dentipellis fragilis]|uniref:Fe2OG dioxygenase domain-containing protein n=1 Tax=Dentipellis fragilis TaxID=205917 RepID=A0A4Y9YX74_9AGAM|nr:hypothetical protein EVG20_g4252 [Dentipellis fragilis]